MGSVILPGNGEKCKHELWGNMLSQVVGTFSERVLHSFYSWNVSKQEWGLLSIWNSTKREEEDNTNLGVWICDIVSASYSGYSPR